MNILTSFVCSWTLPMAHDFIQGINRTAAEMPGRLEPPWRKRNPMLAVVAKRLGVSRTAVQKALHGLAEKGILDDRHEPTQYGWNLIDHVVRQRHILEK